MTKPHSNLKDFIFLPRVEAYPSRSDWEKACWKILLRFPDVLDRIMTLPERHAIVIRVAAASRLRAGISYRDIGRELWLSPQTISVIKKGIREHEYRSYAVRSKSERKKKVYSVLRSEPRRKIRIGRPQKTKYGTIYS